MFFLKNKKDKKKEKGFSLMELLVVIALLIIILSVSLFNYDRFGKDIELENAVYSISLAIREAQVYGINKALKDIGNGSDETPPKGSFGGGYTYGIYFEKGDEAPNDDANKKKFLLFRGEEKTDFNCNNYECYSHIFLTKGNYIYDLEVYDGASWSSESGLMIFFKRPNPEAIIRSKSTQTRRSKARISVKDPSGQYKRCVIIGAAGDITVSRNCSQN